MTLAGQELGLPSPSETASYMAVHYGISGLVSNLFMKRVSLWSWPGCEHGDCIVGMVTVSGFLEDIRYGGKVLTLTSNSPGDNQPQCQCIWTLVRLMSLKGSVLGSNAEPLVKRSVLNMLKLCWPMLWLKILLVFESI